MNSQFEGMNTEDTRNRRDGGKNHNKRNNTKESE